jgi:short-subunit dehydrogenase
MGDQTAVVTGATRGLGYAIAKKLAEAGYNLVLIAKNKERLRAAQSDLSELNVEVKTLACDFSVAEELNQLEDTLRTLKRVDVLVNNTGIFALDRFENTDAEKLNQYLQVNCLSAIQITQALQRNLKQHQGHIFNIGSVVSENPKSIAFTYSISKAALQSFTEMLREDMRASSVKVTEVVPGSINTTSWDGEDVPRELFIQPSDIASALVNCLTLSKNANFEKLVIRPLDQRF